MGLLENFVKIVEGCKDGERTEVVPVDDTRNNFKTVSIDNLLGRSLSLPIPEQPKTRHTRPGGQTAGATDSGPYSPQHCIHASADGRRD